MRLLGVERQNPVGQRFVGTDERGDLPEAEHFCRREAVSAVRCPELTVLPAHYDQRVEKGARLIDLFCQALGMRGRQVALERRRLHGFQWQGGEQQRPTAQWIAVGTDYDAIRGVDHGHQTAEVGVFARQRNLGARQPAFARRRLQAAA